MRELEIKRPVLISLERRIRRQARGLRLLRSLVGSKPALFGAIVVMGVIASAIFAPLIAPYDPVAQDIPRRLSPPTWSFAPGTYFLGGDGLGRDILSRIIYGSQISLIVGLCSVAVAGTIGVILGAIAGYYGGRLDSLIMRLVDMQMAIPFLVLAIAVVAVLGPSLQNIIIVLGVTGWVTYSRVVRGQVLAVREATYIEAARAIGAGNVRTMFGHVLPNVATSVIVIATLEVARMIIAEASLSFLGLGVQPPTPSWGGMVAEGKDVLSIAWWLSAFPGLAILFTVLGINLLGDWLREVLDPRLRL